jgi:5-formyltetrahydrofolate cyclo-ligase
VPLANQKKRTLTGMGSKTGKQLQRGKQRKLIRAQRRALTPLERKLRSDSLCSRLFNQPVFRSARNIALYLPADGEVDTASIVGRCWTEGKQVYLPVLTPFRDNKLWFTRYKPDTRLVSNRFGIPEPEVVHRQRIKPLALDLVLTPLVGFDNEGNRLGMGGGYYDRSFAFLLRRQSWKKPRLVGLAYAFQQLEKLPARSWDVPLTAVATDTHWHSF